MLLVKKHAASLLLDFKRIEMLYQTKIKFFIKDYLLTSSKKVYIKNNCHCGKMCCNSYLHNLVNW